MASPVLIGCRAVNAPKGKSDHSPKSDRQKSDRFLERVRQIANIQLKTIANNARHESHKNYNKINKLYQAQTTFIGRVHTKAIAFLPEYPGSEIQKTIAFWLEYPRSEIGSFLPGSFRPKRSKMRDRFLLISYAAAHIEDLENHLKSWQ